VQKKDNEHSEKKFLHHSSWNYFEFSSSLLLEYCFLTLATTFLVCNVPTFWSWTKTD